MSNPVEPRDPDETVTTSSYNVQSVSGFGPSEAAGEVGTLGPYRVLKELGKGGMGAVYLALDTRLERQSALKVMLPEFAADHDAKSRFLREARAAAKISHDNVVTVFEADDRDGMPYIAMQFLKGYPLDQYLNTKGTPPLPHAIRIVREAALGLAAAHQLGLVHRDIKPANLWLESPNGRVKVLDFGLAKPVGSESELTRNGAMVGTPLYMSPEQARGLNVDTRTDLYSLGAVLYRLCTGQTPFSGPNVMAVLSALLTEEPTPVRDLNPNLPETLAQFIHLLLAKKPEDRPQTANEVAKSLRTILDQWLAPNAPGVALGGAVPGAPSPDLSVSQPVGVPVQPPVVAPMQITARSEAVFANRSGKKDTSGATQIETASAAPKSGRKKNGRGKKSKKSKKSKKRLLIGVGVALLAVVVGAVVVSQMGKKEETEAKSPKTDTTGSVKDQNPSKGPNTPTDKNSIGMEFVKVPKGTGWLGGGGGKPGDRKVEFKEDFYLGKYEVTQWEWQQITGLTPSEFKRGNAAVKGISDADLKRFPVEMVSWDDCQEFIAGLNRKEKESGWTYRLPKDAEWEYACRGGPIDKSASGYHFYFAKPSNTPLPGQANYGYILKRTCKVGSYEPNLLGLCDMHGNVSEWCEDTANAADGSPLRRERNGQWGYDPIDCRALIRFTTPPSKRTHGIGLRLVRVPQRVQS